MCRNIKTLFNFEPPASELEIRDASLQFVRKLSGFTVPSKANEAAFDRELLERDNPQRRAVDGAVHARHASATEQLAELVATRNRCGCEAFGGAAMGCTRHCVAWPL